MYVRMDVCRYTCVYVCIYVVCVCVPGLATTPTFRCGVDGTWPLPLLLLTPGCGSSSPSLAACRVCALRLCSPLAVCSPIAAPCGSGVAFMAASGQHASRFARASQQICMCVRVHEYMHACTARTHACMHICMCVFLHWRMHTCIYKCMRVCIYVHMFCLCMYVCMYVCMSVCM